ncbi:MAG: DUF1810 family protein [Synechococcaceae cyanobacterium]|nr:DUF1810 family protein [Synechococcaceae cyanobacterium]
MAPSAAGLDRFHQAQEGVHGPGSAEALREIRAGRKRSHWIWYVLPQLAGLGHSAMAQRYGIADCAEAQAYLADPVLGPRLAEITDAIARQLQAGVTLEALLGALDARKTVSSLTLFVRAAQDSSGPWIPPFLEQANAVLDHAASQGIPRCSLTRARLGQNAQRQTLTSSAAEIQQRHDLLVRNAHLLGHQQQQGPRAAPS